MNGLFDEQFLAAVGRLSVDVARAPAAVRAGSHPSRAAGSSLDFRDYRPYTPGDDPRRVDWNVFRRSGHLFVRQFEHPTAIPVHVLIDNSASMFVEAPPRYAAAARVAGAVSAAILRGGHNSVGIVSFGGKAGLSNIRGIRRLPEVLGFLTGLRPEEPASVSRAVQYLSNGARRLGVVVVVSDFFEPDGIDAVVSSLQSLPHRLVLVQVTQPWDAEPELLEDAELVDCESGRTVSVAPRSSTFAAYREAYTRHQDALREFADRRASAMFAVDASADLIPQLAVLFPDGVLRVHGGPA